MSYWEALSELHPADAVAAARTEPEREFAEGLGDLMSGHIEIAEDRFGKLRQTANDSVIRAGSRVVYTATLQYQEKWQTLSSLKKEQLQKPEMHDKASIELWADAYSQVPAKKFTFRTAQARVMMSMSAVGTPLIPVRIAGKDYNFWLDTGSSLTMLASDVANDLKIRPLISDTLEIVTSTRPDGSAACTTLSRTVRNASTSCIASGPAWSSPAFTAGMAPMMSSPNSSLACSG